MIVTTQNKEDCEDRLVSAGEFKRAVGIHAATLRNWRRKNMVKFVTLPSGRFRFPASEIDRILKERAPTPEVSQGNGGNDTCRLLSVPTGG